MREVTMSDLYRIEHILDGVLLPFRTYELDDPKYFIEDSVGNACYTHLADDHYTIEHHLSSGGRVTIDVKYEPDWTDEGHS